MSGYLRRFRARVGLIALVNVLIGTLTTCLMTLTGTVTWSVLAIDYYNTNLKVEPLANKQITGRKKSNKV